MFIAARTTSSLSPVNQRQIRQINGMNAFWHSPYGICRRRYVSKHINKKYAVPTELKREETTFSYKHIVPTGLKKLPKYLFNLHTVCATFLSESRIIADLSDFADYNASSKCAAMF